MNVCIFGDSITWGGYDPENGGWATILRNHLEKDCDDVNVYNLGICSDNSSGVLKRLVLESTPRQPEIIIIAIGANDVKHQPNQEIDFGRFEENIKLISTQAEKIARKVIFLSITPVDESLTTPRNKPPYNYRENKDIDKCNQILRTFAGKHNFKFIPMPKNFGASDLADGLHPNTAGHQKIFNTLRPVVYDLISSNCW